MIFNLNLILLSFITHLALAWAWETPIVNLPYGSYSGYYNESSSMNVFRSIRYAASTTGENRWRNAQPPVNMSGMGIQNASDWPAQCPQGIKGGVDATTYTPTEDIDSEDCLFAAVYAPPNLKNAPVVVFIHGGSWDHLSMREFDAQPLVNAAGNTFIAIVIQYRLGLFGFLASPEMKSSNGLNCGITDSAYALQWVQDNVHYFGGDKDKVTIWGQSAGGGTIFHLIAAQAENGRKALWKTAMTSSPYMPNMGRCDSGQWAAQYKNITLSTNCTGSNSLECLRKVPSDILRNLNHQLDDTVNNPRGSVYPYLPCIEGMGGYLVNDSVVNVLNGKVAGDYFWGGSNYHDGLTAAGTNLNPASNSTNFTAQADYLFIDYVTHYFPITNSSIPSLLDEYKLEDFQSNQYRAAQVYQDVVFACSATWLADAFGDKSWRYLYAQGAATHAIDNGYEFPYFYSSYVPSSPSFYDQYIGSAINVITSSPPSPNSNITQLPPNAPFWPSWDKGQYMLLNETVGNVSDIYVSQGDYHLGGRKRCDFWANLRRENIW